MSETVKQLGTNPFRTDLESEVVTLPGRSWRSVVEIFAHLEALAARSSRDSCFALEAESTPDPQHLFMKSQPEADAAGGISFREMGRHVLRAARAQVRALRARAQEVQAMVLINDWHAADTLWGELLADCKTPLFELSFLEELWGIRPERLEPNGWSLTRHWHQIVLVQAEIEVLLARRQSLLELSNALERRLGDWLKRFAEILGKIDEESMP